MMERLALHRAMIKADTVSKIDKLFDEEVKPFLNENPRDRLIRDGLTMMSRRRESLMLSAPRGVRKFVSDDGDFEIISGG